MEKKTLAKVVYFIIVFDFIAYIVYLIVFFMVACSSEKNTKKDEWHYSNGSPIVCRVNHCGKTPVYSDWDDRFCYEHLDRSINHSNERDSSTVRKKINTEKALTLEEADALRGTGYKGNRPNSVAEDMALKAAMVRCKNCGMHSDNGANSLCNECQYNEDYKEYIESAETESAENNNCFWEVSYYTDELMQTYSNAYITNKEPIRGQFFNDTTSEDLAVELKVYKNNVVIEFYKNGGDMVKDSSPQAPMSYNITMLSFDGKEYDITDIKGSMNCEDSRLIIDDEYTSDVFDILCKEGTVDFYLQDDSTAKNSYSFSVETDNFCDEYSSSFASEQFDKVEQAENADNSWQEAVRDRIKNRVNDKL